MAKKISNESFVDSNFGQPVIDALQEILKLTDELIVNLKKVGKESEGALDGLNPAENVKDSNKLNEVLQKLLKTQEEITQLQSDKIKLESDLKKLQDQRNKQDKAALDIAVKTNKVKQEEQKTLLAEQKLQAQILKNTIAENKERERQEKIREREAKQRSKNLTEYQKESRRLNELRNAYKELAIAEKENSDEARELLKEITALDSRLKEIDKTVGQNQRNVGNYEQALEGLNNTLSTLGVVAIITKGFELLGSVFGESREGALALEIALSKITETAKVFIQSVINSGEGFRQVFSGITSSVQSFFVETELKFLSLQRTLQSGLDFFGVDAAEQEIQSLDTEIEELNKTLEELQNNDISEGITKIGEAFSGTIDTTSRAIEEQEKFLELQLQTTIQIQQQERALAGLAEQRQILQDISDDDTLGFIERQKFVERAQKAAVEFAALENRLALTRERLTIEAVKQDLRRAQALSESRLAQIQTGEQLRAVLQDESLARKVSDANDEAFSQAFIERRNKEVEADAFRRDQEEKNRITARDAFEQELDIIEEFGEKRVEANQRIIDSDEASLEQRRKALEENEKIEQQLFDQSIERIIRQGKESIDIRKDLTEAEKERRKELLETADIQKILNAETETETLQLIKQLDLGEIETNRLKETIKLNKDLSTARLESSKALEETNTRTLELQEEIAIQQRKLNGEAIDLEDELLQNQKENLQERIDGLEENSIKRLELQRQLNELLLEEQEQANEKSVTQTEDAEKKRADAIRTASQLITNLIEQDNERRLNNIDEQLAAIQERQSSIRAAAERGNEEAVNSLAESERAEAEIRAKKEQELKRQQRIEAGLAAFQVFAANAEEDPNTALSRTFTDITALTAFINSLPSFFVGTEDTGKVSGGLDSNGGRLAVLHNNERVLNKKDNDRIKQAGITSNEELTRLAVESKRGTFRQFENVSPSQAVMVQSESESLKEDIQELIRAVKMNRPVDPSQSFDKRTGVLKEIVKKGGSINNLHKPLFHPKRKR